MLNWGPLQRKYEDPWWRQLTIDHVQRADVVLVELERFTEAKPVRCCWTGCSCGANADARGAETLELLWAEAEWTEITNIPLTESGCKGEKVRNHDEAVGQVVKFRREGYEEQTR